MAKAASSTPHPAARLDIDAGCSTSGGIAATEPHPLEAGTARRGAAGR